MIKARLAEQQRIRMEREARLGMYLNLICHFNHMAIVSLTLINFTS